MVSHSIKHMLFSVKVIFYIMWEMGVTKTKTLENEDLRPKTRLSFRDYEN